MEKQTVLDSSSYGPRNIRASTLDSIGVDFTFLDMTDGEGKFGVYYVICGKDAGGDLTIMFNSEKLAKLVKENLAILIGKSVNLAGKGEGVTRTYLLTV